MADRSPAGWATVEEYLSDELASDSEDEKRIRSAEARAIRKRTMKKSDRISTSSTITSAPGHKAKKPTHHSTASRITGDHAQKINSGEICASDVDKSDIGEMPAQISSHSHLKMPDIQNNNNVKYNLSFGFNFGDGINVKGRLKASIKFWESIDASEFVLNTIKYGYKIPFVTVPQNFVFENNRSAKLEHEFVTENILKLLNNGLVREVQIPPNIVSPLSVAKSSSGKLRLILDLRYVNAHI